MANGDIKGASILSSGWAIAITYEGMSAAGTHDLGLGADNDPTTANIVLSLTSEGYNVSGVLGTTARAIYGVPCDNPDLGAMRKVYPNDADPDETVSGSDLIVNYALSHAIYDDDVSVTVDVAAATYNDGSIDNNSSDDYSVTNNSTLDYPKVIMNAASAQNQLVVGTSLHLELFGFHQFSEEGKPLACVKYEIEDENSNIISGTITDLTISSDSPINKILTYAIDESLTSLTDGDICEVRYVGYPWVGDADSILNSDDAVNSMPTPLYTNLTFRLDKTDVHGKTVVDATSGNDGTGEVYSTEVAAEAGNYFQTVAAAMTAMATYNGTNAGHSDAGGGIVLLTEDTHILDSSNGGTLDTWVTIKPMSTASKESTIFQADGTIALFPNMMKLEGLTHNGTGYFQCTSVRYAWLHDCAVATTGTTTFYRIPYGVATNNTGYLAYEFDQFSSQPSNWALIRGNSMDDAHTSKGWVVLGNNNVIVTQRSNTGVPLNDNLIFMFNTSDDNNIANQIIVASTENYTHGVAIGQNKMVRYGSQTQPMMQISADGTTTTTNNICIFNNTIAGARVNLGYNDEASGGPYAQTNWMMKNNIFSNWNNKDDTFGDNADSTGSWSVGYKVNGSGNHFRTTALDEWLGEFKGLWAQWGTVAVPLEPSYVDDQSADGGDTSGGDYHLEGDSPSLGLARDLILPYDLDGRERPSATADNPGAWTYKETTGSNWFYNKFIGGV